jgi:hypothetical protein
MKHSKVKNRLKSYSNIRQYDIHHDDFAMDSSDFEYEERRRKQKLKSKKSTRSQE